MHTEENCNCSCSSDKFKNKGLWGKTKEMSKDAWEHTKNETEAAWQKSKALGEDIVTGTKHTAKKFENKMSRKHDDYIIEDEEFELDYSEPERHRHLNNFSNHRF